MKFLFLALFFISCSNDKFPKSSSLESFRILALVSDTPEIDEAGGVVQMSLWVSDPSGGSRALDVTYATCIDPGVVFGKDPECEGATETTISNISLSSQNRTEELNNLFSISVPANLLTNLASKDQFNGINFLVTVKIETQDEIIKSFKRIKISNKSGADLNTNPSITSLSFDGILPTLPSDKAQVLATLGSGAQNFDYIDGDDSLKTKTEELYISWFTTSGEFIPSVTLSTESSKLDLENSPTNLTVIGIVRDSRGGVGVFKQEF